MEYFDITQKLVDNLNQAVLNDSGKDFFETLGFNVYDCSDGRWELSGVHTKGGVEMIIMIDKEDWIDSFEEYYDCFDVDEEIRIYREDPYGSYCKNFTCRQSVDDFEDWDAYVKELVDIAKSSGQYKYRKHLYHDSASFVLIFPKTEKFKLDELDKLDDNDLLDLYYANSDKVKKLSIDEFSDDFNRHGEYVMNNYLKFIG